MVQFIKQEASEKAREIAIATEEEFNIEKLSMVDGEKIKIAKEYERKELSVDTAKKIEASTSRNAMRLKVLAAREAAVQSVLDEARESGGVRCVGIYVIVVGRIVCARRGI